MPPRSRQRWKCGISPVMEIHIIALEIGRYDFVIRVRLEDGRPVGRREDPA
jgi:hypothetical protein